MFSRYSLKHGLECCGNSSHRVPNFIPLTWDMALLQERIYSHTGAIFSYLSTMPGLWRKL